MLRLVAETAGLADTRKIELMMSTDLNNVLSLIAAAIFADKHVYASEIEAFIDSTRKLPLAQRLDPKLSEARLLTWYETNKDGIRQKLATPYFKDWFYDLLEQLSGLPDKETILPVMHTISHADGNVHVSERALVTLAERYWNIKP